MSGSHIRTRAVVRLLHAWFVLSRPMTLGVRVVVHDEAQNSVLLVRHTYVQGYQLPGGGVEPGETMEQALARELEEEAKILLDGAPELKSIHFNRQASRRDHVAVYLVRYFHSAGAFVPNREIAEARFYPLDALPAETTAATRRRLDEVLQGVAPQSCW